jgi:tRNA A37 methylthiotransferase MiaB
MLSEQGVREVTLLGQNVNSYADRSHLEPHPPPPPSFAPAPSPGAATAALQPQLDPSAPSTFEAHYARGFRSVYVPRRAGAARFADLLHAVAAVDPELRVRFTSPHPKDFSDDVLSAIAAHPNVCTQLHMPAQSGSSAVLERMRRGYSREAYDELVAHVRAVLPGVALSTDMIAGFCGEGEADHAASVDLLASTGFDAAFLFAYSERERTHAARRHADDVPPGVKSRRLGELVAAHRAALHARAAAEVGRRHVILVEGPSRKAPQMLTGLTDTNKRVVIEDGAVPPAYSHAAHQHQDAEATAHSSGVRLRPGDYAAVEVTAATGATLHARVLARTTLAEFVLVHGSAAPLGLHGGR